MKKFLAIVLVVALIAAAILLLLHFKGFGGFGKKSEKGEEKNDTSVSEVADKTEPITSEKVTEKETEGKTNAEVISISISKNEYVYNNSMLSFDELIKEISSKEKDVQIEVTIDDTAAKNTVDKLTDRLDELGYKNYKKIEK
ncbi:hypothetical protein [uncultured Ruminococcus sp.]|uniref:hypothetical protein n=1 Tax=uncultured Ruminococcus sp. TaxID=165186 RepID=UPI0025E21011|nr:hypothetical protein [uncultured Ruminococcus sp.]